MTFDPFPAEPTVEFTLCNERKWCLRMLRHNLLKNLSCLRHHVCVLLRNFKRLRSFDQLPRIIGWLFEFLRFNFHRHETKVECLESNLRSQCLSPGKIETCSPPQAVQFSTIL